MAVDAEQRKLVGSAVSVEDQREILEVLESIRANQDKQLEGLAESLELQRRQFEMARVQYDRAERLNDRAEKIQETSQRIMATARKSLFLVLPIIVFLLGYLSWLIFR